MFYLVSWSPHRFWWYYLVLIGNIYVIYYAGVLSSHQPDSLSPGKVHSEIQNVYSSLAGFYIAGYMTLLYTVSRYPCDKAVNKNRISDVIRYHFTTFLSNQIARCRSLVQSLFLILWRHMAKRGKFCNGRLENSLKNDGSSVCCVLKWRNSKLFRRKWKGM